MGGGVHHPPVRGRQRLPRVLPHHDDTERQEKQNQVSTKNILPKFKFVINPVQQAGPFISPVVDLTIK